MPLPVRVAPLMPSTAWLLPCGKAIRHLALDHLELGLAIHDHLLALEVVLEPGLFAFTAQARGFAMR
jgi:hypothetical protein